MSVHNNSYNPQVSQVSQQTSSNTTNGLDTVEKATPTNQPNQTPASTSKDKSPSGGSCLNKMKTSIIAMLMPERTTRGTICTPGLLYGSYTEKGGTHPENRSLLFACLNAFRAFTGSG